MTISSCHTPALGSNPYKSPPELGQFGNVWGNRGKKLDEEGENLSRLNILNTTLELDPLLVVILGNIVCHFHQYPWCIWRSWIYPVFLKRT